MRRLIYRGFGRERVDRWNLCLCAEQVGKSSDNFVAILQGDDPTDWLQFWYIGGG
jgi:hypothetical protein